MYVYIYNIYILSHGCIYVYVAGRPEEDAVVWCVDAAACNKSCNYYAEWAQVLTCS